MEQQIHLSKPQVQKLFKYVDYLSFIDLKYEIVDHLASNIEAKMQADPDKTFNTALYEETSTIPITGFHNFIVSKEKALTKYWYNKIVIFLKNYMTFPKALLSIGCIYLLFKINFFIQPVPFQWLGLSITFITTIIIGQLSNYNEEKYLFIMQFRNILRYSSLAFLALWWITKDATELSNTIVLFFASVMTCQIILAFAFGSKAMKQMLMNEINIKFQHLFLDKDTTQ